jgi:hypothetical protein
VDRIALSIEQARGQDSIYYGEKRLKLLQSGLVFVEIDYLHETPPTFPRLPNYSLWGRMPQPQPGAHAYRILVVDPRPTLQEGISAAYQFDVDDPIPVVTIPLNAGDKLDFDFNAPYQKTYEEMLYGLQPVDYSSLPLRFDSYSRDDPDAHFAPDASCHRGSDTRR